MIIMHLVTLCLECRVFGYVLAFLSIKDGATFLTVPPNDTYYTDFSIRKTEEQITPNGLIYHIIREGSEIPLQVFGL